jgi:hypothetical protein
MIWECKKGNLLLTRTALGVAAGERTGVSHFKALRNGRAGAIEKVAARHELSASINSLAGPKLGFPVDEKGEQVTGMSRKAYDRCIGVT